jgi:hypothetical protein
MIDLRVVIAGPIGTVPESRVRHHRGGYSVGRMHQMIGPGTRAFGHHWQVRPPPARSALMARVSLRLFPQVFETTLTERAGYPALDAYFRIAAPKLRGPSSGR